MSHQAQFQLQQIAGVISSVVPAELRPSSIRPNIYTLVRIPCFVNNAVPPSHASTQVIQVISGPTEASLVTSPSPAEVVDGGDLQGKIDLRVRNVVSMFNVCCHVDLHALAMCTPNVVYELSRGVVMWQLRNPNCHARISACGKVIVTGATSEMAAKRASRRVARWIQRKVNPSVNFADYRITNMMASCKLPFGLRLVDLALAHPKECSYEPEINTGLIWRNSSPKLTLRIHSTGSVTITGATSEANVLSAMDSLYPVLLRYKVAYRSGGAIESPLATSVVSLRF
ncbi:transcription factor TFIID [Trichuris suis]|nr:transcription factor TFIID [Trichuris suis]